MQKVGVVSAEGPFVIFGAEFVPFCSRVFFPTEPTGIFAPPEDLQDEELEQQQWRNRNDWDFGKANKLMN